MSIQNGDAMKYIHLGAGSWVKGQNDRLKYEKAKKLKGMIDEIRKDYEQKLLSSKDYRRECGTIVYMIDRLALRVGNDKDDEEEADTVGCCSLRHEHIKFPDKATVEAFNEEASKGPFKDGSFYVELDFLGKDSIRYHNIVEVPEIVKKNLEDFKRRAERAARKDPDEGQLFELGPSDINDYLKRFMKDLSAKVFRTYNASETLQTELAKYDYPDDIHGYCIDNDAAFKFYNEANRQVAILCNHQKAASSDFEVKIQEQKDKVDEKKADFERAERELKKIKKNGGDEKATTAAQKKVDRLKQAYEKADNAVKMKEDNKTVALGTSKINYMDPRISVIFCKRSGLPLEKVFTGSMRAKFPWAQYTPMSWRF
jgi:DNA topoisomerase-1